MNIFYLDKDPMKCAEYHCDQHCVKMIIEYAQIMSTAHRVLDGYETYRICPNYRKHKIWILGGEKEDILYKSTHINHPCAIWCRESSENYNFLYKLYCALCDEFEKRYEKDHKTCVTLCEALKKPPENIPVGDFTEPPRAMAEEYILQDTVDSYRNFYLKDKVRFATWKNGKPDWFKSL